LENDSIHPNTFRRVNRWLFLEVSFAIISCQMPDSEGVIFKIKN